MRRDAIAGGFLRSLCACLRVDCTQGFRSVAVLLAGIPVLATSLMGFGWLSARGWDVGAWPQSGGDVLAVCLAGMNRFNPALDDRFVVPAAWLFILMYLSFIPLSYPSRDLGGFGSHLLLAAGSTWTWWLSKVIWVALCCFVEWALLVATVVALGTVTGGSMGLAVSEVSLFIMQVEVDFMLVPAQAASLAVGTFAALVSICSVQVLVSIVAEPVTAYLVTALQLVASAYVFHPLLVGNYAMAARSEGIVSFGFPLCWGLGLCAAAFLAACVFGGAVLSRRDIIGKGGSW